MIEAGGTWRRTRSNRAIELVIVLAAGIYLGLLGPFGNYLADEPLIRIAYWTGMLVVGSVLLTAGYRSWEALTSELQLPRPIGWVAALLATSGITGLLSNAIAVRMWPQVQSVPGLTWYLQGLIILIPLALLKAVLQRRADNAAMPLDRRVAALAQAQIDCLTVEDHYVRIYDRNGSRLVYGTFKDAVADLGDRDGMQVHRSWWVARDAVAKVIAEGRRVHLVLRNGLEVPVARSCVARLRSAGWIASEPVNAELAPARPSAPSGSGGDRTDGSWDGAGHRPTHSTHVRTDDSLIGRTS